MATGMAVSARDVNGSLLPHLVPSHGHGVDHGVKPGGPEWLRGAELVAAILADQDHLKARVEAEPPP